MFSLFSRDRADPPQPAPDLEVLLRSASIEVLPRTLAAIADVGTLLPRGTRTYVAHIDGTPIEDMVSAARRLAESGLEPMPHIPARLIRDKHELRQWLARYRDEAGVTQALVLGGGRRIPAGQLESAMQLLETGLFDAMGFERIHVAGHPEGNADIDPDKSGRLATEALLWKQVFSERTDARVAIVTQFVFESAPALAWVRAIRAAGVELPIHIGLAGPARLTSLLKYAVACGVGNSIRVLHKRAKDVTKLALPFEPTELAVDFAKQVAANPELGIEALHFFPLGGIRPCVDWLERHRATYP